MQAPCQKMCMIRRPNYDFYSLFNSISFQVQKKIGSIIKFQERDNRPSKCLDKYSEHWIWQTWISRPIATSMPLLYRNSVLGYNNLKFHLLSIKIAVNRYEHPTQWTCFLLPAAQRLGHRLV